jgi:hypothetical protein
MDDKQSHIEDWMRRAAAQPPAPDDAGEELKRQSWSKMAALLDADKAARPQSRLERLLPGRAAVLIPIIASSVVFAATVWLAPRFSKTTKPAEHSSIAKERPYNKHKGQQTGTDTPLVNINTTTPQSTPADSIAGFAGTIAAPVSEGGKPAYAGPDGSLAGAANAVPHGHNQGSGTPDNKAAGNYLARNGRGISPAMVSNRTSTPERERTLPHNKVNKATVSGIANDNEAVADGQTITPKRFSDRPAERAVFEAGQAVLRPVRNRNVFALQLPTLSAASREQHIPVSFAAGNGVLAGHPEVPWVLQAGLLSPLNSAFGVRVGILYRYPLGYGWSLQPQVSVSYLTGYNRQFTHVAVSKQLRDSGTGSAGQYLFNLDTITTPYTFKHAVAGSLGINLGYRITTMAVSTGLVYSLAMPSGRQDTISKRSGMMRDSLAIPSSGPVFSTGKLPGRQQLSWNVDVSWYVFREFQVGINYRVMLWRSKGDKAFQAPLQKVQDNSMLELYIRIPVSW